MRARWLPRALRRVRPTASLSGLGLTARRHELIGALAVHHPADIRKRSVLLVDDVVTTGATAEECARILKAAGADRVYVATAARRMRKGAFH